MAAVPYIDDNRVTSAVRILLVEDFEPFRRLVCSTLRNKTGLQVVGEVFDGLEAVQKAAELQPDLVLLDIGLPTLNGIEAARRIRNLAPKSKIIFVSQESSSAIVQEAFALGACGYVAKTKVSSDLLPAVEAVRQGRQFVSDGLLGRNCSGVTDALLSGFPTQSLSPVAGGDIDRADVCHPFDRQL